MPSPDYKTALIVGAGSGLERVAGAAAFEIRPEDRARRAQSGKARRSRRRDRCQGVRLRRLERGAGGEAVRRCRCGARRARCRDLQCELSHPRRLHRAGAGRCREGDRDYRLRRVPDGAAGRAPHAAEQERRHFLHRRFGEREGLCQVGTLRDGEIRGARAGAKPGARVAAAGHSCRAFRDRRRHPVGAAGGGARQAGIRCSIPMRSRRPISMFCVSRAAPGPRRSNCGPGWRISRPPPPARPRRSRIPRPPCAPACPR